MYNIENLRIVLLSVLSYIYVFCINLLIIHVDDRHLSKFYTSLKNGDSYIEELDDDDNDYNIVNEQNDAIVKLCNVNKTLTRYNKKKLNDNLEKLVVKAFLFNYKNNAIVDNYPFTNKLMMINNSYNSMNIRTIKNLTHYRYKYIYILYRTEKGDFKVKIIDMNMNYDIINNTNVLFNSIKLY